MHPFQIRGEIEVVQSIHLVLLWSLLPRIWIDKMRKQKGKNDYSCMKRVDITINLLLQENKFDNNKHYHCPDY